MPEIGEVARTVHYIRKNLIGKTLKKVTALEDANVFGKVGTSHTEFMKNLTGKRVVDAGQQGKYFWMIMSSPPHPVMHFGMAGWLKFKSEHTFYYRKKANEKEDSWPPKFWKWSLETDGTGDDKVEAAFVDMRRFARVRLVDCPAKDIRNVSPLVENGPDPVVDEKVVTYEWLKELCHKKKVPVKAMLLDQANISGIGNWVGDEIMYHAKMHPEQYANTLSDAQIKQLCESIHYVCGTAVDLLADSDQFPEEWLFKHRWGKGKKDAVNKLPNGEKIVFLTVGGRTSAVVPSVQKKTGPVAKEISNDEVEETPKKNTPKKRKAPTKDEEDEEEEVGEKIESEVESKPTPKRSDAKKTGRISDMKVESRKGGRKAAPKPLTNGKAKKDVEEETYEHSEEEEKPLVRSSKRSKKEKDTASVQETKKGTKATLQKTKTKTKTHGVEDGRRRSSRLKA